MKTNLKKLFSAMMLMLVCGVAFATTDVTITVPADLPTNNAYVMTYVNMQYALDFSSVEGLKAYAAKKKMDAYGDALERVELTPVNRVPVGTPVLIKANDATTYSVPLAASVDVIDTDLAVATEPIDLFDAIVTTSWGQVKTGPALLTSGEVIDWSTFSYVTAVGFFPAEKPAAAGETILPVGTVYLPLTAEDKVDGASFSGYVALQFNDGEAPVVPEVNSIAEAKQLPEGTEFALNLTYYQTVTYANAEYFVIQEMGSGIFVHAANTFQAGDIISGTIRGTYTEVLGSFIDDADISGVSVMMNWPDGLYEETDLGTAFGEYVQQLVKLTNLTVHVNGEQSWSVEDEDGTEVAVTTILYAIPETLMALKEGDVIEEMTGFAVIVPETSIYVQYGFYPQYFFDPIDIKLKVPTAIDNLRAASVKKPVYDLQGRRVVAPVKGGVYIQNGKKVILK